MAPPLDPNKRQEFTRGSLRRKDLAEQPLEQFRRWLGEAVDAGVPEPYAVTLATVQPSGLPAARTILLKAVDERGLLFTSADSPKTHDLHAHPHAALVFYWPAQERQVRISGTVELASHEENLALYAPRSHDQRLALLTFPQSQPISGRAALDERFDQLRREHAGHEVPLPDTWGGWRVIPGTVEFWQGGINRLHDRFRYTAGEQGWTLERLAP